jgi:cytosine/adenosine deaminase-related metal-dependent hydrolase
LSQLMLRNVRPFGHGAIDVSVAGDTISAIGRDLPLPAGATVADGAGALLLPGLIEGHTHLDKSLWGGPWHRNEVGPSRLDRIENERAWRARSGHDPAAASLALARDFLANGTTRIRTHADIDTEIGLAHLHGTMRTRDAMAGTIELQIVAFPQSGLTNRPGTEALMDAALREGADVVGGIDPCAIDRDPVRCLDVTFALASRHGRPIDIHLHEPGEMGAFSLDLILERTQALGMQGRVVVSHGFCLGAIPDRDRDGLLARMARLDVAIATTAPASGPVPSLAACRAAGVTVIGGNDGIRDTWTPYARPDMLDRAMHIGLRNALRRDDELEWALECVTSGAARGCGFARYGLGVGDRADLVLVDAATVAEAVVAAPPRRLVVAAGRVATTPP